MIYITGDTHGFPNRFFTNSGEVVPEMQALTNKDVLLVAGDFGYLFSDKKEDPEEHRKEVTVLDHMEELPFDIAFVDGNHENFPWIYEHPVEEWCGGKVHRIRKNIVHLMRGEIFDIQGHTFFVFGGAASIDRARRIPGRHWWPEELPNNREYNNAIVNLEARGGDVEYIVTHTAPTYIIQAMGYNTAPEANDTELCGFLEWVARDSNAKAYKKWFFGHWHLDMDKLLVPHRKNLASQRFRPLMFDMVAIPEAPRRDAGRNRSGKKQSK